MLSFLNRLNLVRYLIVWRVNRSLAFFPRYFSIDLSMVIGAIISSRLPTKEKKAWKKGLDPLMIDYKNSSLKLTPAPEVGWPLNSVLFVYPGKRTYGRDELIFWELKLFGKDADHGLFLEVILPAMEEASYTSDPQWNRRNRIWGHFDIQSVYVARGNQWEPLVSDGRLDLRYRANSIQWLESLRFKPKSLRKFRQLNWMSPFDLTNIADKLSEFGFAPNGEASKYTNAPTLPVILIALISRINQLLNPRLRGTGKISDFLTSDDRGVFKEALQKTNHIPIIKNNIKSAPSTWPGNWIGTQRFKIIPRVIIPYLELASILHIGKQTHFGCGTFVIV